ncbi:hypothetical protein BDZ90DRAFT_231490, partial [Jaminaea rosea]
MDVDPPAGGGAAEEEGEGEEEEGEDEDGEEVEALDSGELFVARCRANRSAATLYLTWVWLELRSRLKTCPLTGKDLTYTRVHPRGPLTASLAAHAAHAAHNLPISYGWSSPLPSSIGDFDEGSV